MTEREALRCAIDHIKHMAAWIARLNSGYSFESLGEDMPGIEAALNLIQKPEPTHVRWLGEPVESMSHAKLVETVCYLIKKQADDQGALIRQHQTLAGYPKP